MYIDRFRKLIRQYGYANTIKVLQQEIRELQPARWEIRAAEYLTVIADAESQCSADAHDIALTDSVVRYVQGLMPVKLPEKEPPFMQFSLCVRCAIPASLSEYNFSEFYFLKLDGKDSIATYALILINRDGGAAFHFDIDWSTGKISTEDNELYKNENLVQFIVNLLFTLFSADSPVIPSEYVPRLSKKERHEACAVRHIVTQYDMAR